MCAAFGGLSKAAQFTELRRGAEAAVATPGRMIDLIRMKACNTRRLTYLASWSFVAVPLCCLQRAHRSAAHRRARRSSPPRLT